MIAQINRTMDLNTKNRRYDIFISSTHEDLKEERNKIIHIIIRYGHFPVVMENFPAGPKNIEAIEEKIKQSDIFVILIGARYGSKIASNRTETYVTYELNLAEKYEKPILPFLLDREEYLKKREEFKEQDPERAFDEELRALRDRVKKHPDGTGRGFKYFKTESGSTGDPEHIENIFEHSLKEAIDRLKGEGGWIRSELYDEIRNNIILNPTASKNPFFKRLATHLNTFGVLSLRCNDKNSELKLAISECFLDQYLAKIIAHEKKNIFFESGSSIAYLSMVFVEKMKKEFWVSNYANKFKFNTNNILTFLEFVFSVKAHIELHPDGPPEPKYGATFGDLINLPKHAPSEESFKINEKANKAKNEIRDWFREKYTDNGLIFFTISGFDHNKDNGFFGPHVGDFYNMLFKRGIVESGCPAVIFADEDKIIAPFKPGNCFQICSSDFTWEKVMENSPIAIAVGISSRDKGEELVGFLEGLGFRNFERKYRFDTGEPSGLIVSNDRFQQVWANNLAVC